MKTIENIGAAETLRAKVNERAFFKSMRHLFASSFSVIGEMVQNSRRAQATEIAITCDAQQRLITISDNGMGIDNFDVLLDLATSGWTSTEVQLSDKPFGMGFFSSTFAAARVVVLSKGKCLEITQEDVIEQRTLNVHRQTPGQMASMGDWVTRIELHDVTDDLLPKAHPVEQVETNFQKKLNNLLRGFPLPVSFNGTQVKRTSSLQALKAQGEQSAVGFAYIRGVHTEEGAHFDLMPPTTSNTDLFLQGLPIEKRSEYYLDQLPRYIVHLDSAHFIAKMPDRSHLYDSEKQLARIHSVLTEAVRNHLVKEKAALDGAAFMSRYWSTAENFGMLRMFNDVPFLPATKLQRVENVALSTDYQDVLVGLDFAPHKKCASMVSYEDIKSGLIRIWRDAPGSVSDDPWAATALKTMQSAEIYSVNNHRLDKGHWIHGETPSYNDLHFEVQVSEPGTQVVSYCWQSSSADIREAKSATVVITSEIDPTFRQEHVINENWLLVPDQESAENDGLYEYSYDCWLLGENDTSPDHPVNALATFNDEYDHYQEDWESDAKAAWDNKLAVLHDNHLSVTVGRLLNDGAPQFSESNLGQLVMVRLEKPHSSYLAAPDQYSRTRLDVVPVEEEMMQAICDKLASMSGVAVNVEQLGEAIWHAVRPGELCDGPKNGSFHRNSMLIEAQPE